jgi:uncharacterized phage protein (TIGR01671 family)
MREIKFRAWDIIQQKMFYDVQDTYDENNADHFGGLLNNKIYHVMQYTGLNDCNGKEIYDGDILIGQICFPKDSEKRVIETFCVRWSKYRCAFIFSDKIDGKQTIGKWCQFFELCDRKIIGNIYENPELMGGIK